MARIGAIDVKLGVSTGGFARGTQEGSKALKSLGSGFDQAGARGESFGGALQSAGGRLKGFLAAAAGAAALGGLTKLLTDGVKGLDEMARTADRAGVSADALRGLQHAARMTGSDVGAMTGLVGGLNQRLAEAATEDNGTAAALRGLGLSARELLAAGPDAAVGKIADALKRVEDPGERAAQTARVFGEQGLELARVLDLGSAGLAKYAAESQALSGSFSAVDAGKVREANASFALLSDSVEALKTRLVVALAPAVSSLAGTFAGSAKSGVASLGSVGSGAEVLASAIRYCAQGVEVLKLAFQALRLVVTRTFEAAARTVALLSHGVDLLANRGKESGSTAWLRAFSDELGKAGDEQTKVLKDAWLAAPPENRIKGFFDEIAASADKAGKAIEKVAPGAAKLGPGLAAAGVNQQVADLKRELALTGEAMGRGQDWAKLRDLKMRGATDEQLAPAARQGYDNAIKGDVMGNITGFLGKTLDPMRKVVDELGKATYLFKRGQLSEAQYQVARLGAMRETLDLQTGGAAGGAKFAGAAEVGTAEARSALLAATAGGGPADLARQGVEVQKRQLDFLMRIYQATLRNENAQPPAAVAAAV